MTREWNSKPNQTPHRKPTRKSNSNSSLFLIAGIAFASYIGCKNTINAPFNLILPQNSSISTSTSQSHDGINIVPTIGNRLTTNSTKSQKLDNIARSLQYQGSSIAQLADLLSRYARTDAEKARIIYSWIAQHIAYDAQSFFSGNYEYLLGEEVLKRRQAICSGYANLYQELAKAMNLQAITIEGYAKGDNYGVGQKDRLNHAWNAVKINNSWYLLDVTWGAGTLENRQFSPNFNPYYFATSPQELIYSHFPAQDKWQLLKRPLAKAEFAKLPKVFPSFFNNKLELISHPDNNIQLQGRGYITLRVPADTVISAKLESNFLSLENPSTFVQKQGNNVVIGIAPPSPGKYELTIYSKKKQDPGDYYGSIIYEVDAIYGGEPFPAAFASFIENEGYLNSPNVKYLPPDSLVNFQIGVPKALEVMAIDANKQWIPLSKNGDLFAGNVEVGRGKIQIVAKFDRQDRYWTLLEYN
jgi:hypothetical protein